MRHCPGNAGDRHGQHKEPHDLNAQAHSIFSYAASVTQSCNTRGLMEIIRKGFSAVWKIKVRCKRTLLHAVPSRLKRTDKPICSRCNIFQEIRRWQLGRMANMPKSPAMEEIISTLTYRVTLGKTHLFIDGGLRKPTL